MSTAIEHWKAIKEYHEAQLSYAKKMLREFEETGEMHLTQAEMRRRLTYSEMKNRILAFEKREYYKLLWKKAIDQGLLENIQSILNKNTYDEYLELSPHVSPPHGGGPKEESKERFEKIKEYLGPFGGLKWQLFTLKVIELLHSDGSFRRRDEREEVGFDTFEDTAGGCDEITWDAGVLIIQEEVE
jgi:hypothetical protein